MRWLFSGVPAAVNVTTVSLDAEAIVYNVGDGQIYAAVVGSTGVADRIYQVNPNTGALGPSIDLNGTPSFKMVISDDGHYIYVAVDDDHSVQIVDTITDTLGIKVVMPGSGQFFEKARDLFAIPGRPNAFIVSQTLQNFSPPATGTVVYVNGTPLTDRVGNGLGVGGPDIIAVDETGTFVYGYNNSLSSWDLWKMELDEGGVHVATDSPGSTELTGANVGQIRVAKGKLFSNWGHIVDLETYTIIGHYEGGDNSVLDPAGNRLYSVTDSGTTHTIRVYSLSSLELLDSFNITGILGTTSNLTRFDDNGLAFRTSNNQIVLVRSDRIGTPFAATPHLSTSPAIGDEDSAIPLSIDAQLSDKDGSESLRVIISNLPTDAALSAGVLQPDGSWLLTAADLAGLTVTPPHNSDADFSLNVKAISTESSNGSTIETEPMALNVTVHAVADSPSLSTEHLSVGRENSEIPLAISAALNDTDGSETLTIFVGDVPEGARLSAGTDLGGGVWLLARSQLVGLTIRPAFNDDTDFLLTVWARGEESSNGDSADTYGTIYVGVQPVYQPEELLVLGADAGAKPRIQLIDVDDGRTVASFLVYSKDFRGGVRVAIADLNRDGEAEIIVAPGAGMSTLVKVFDVNGHELTDFRTKAYSGFRGGVFVAAGDVNGDGRPDIVTAPDSGMRANIKVFKNRIGIVSPNPDPISNNPIYSFLVFDGSFIGGATVATGDLNHDGHAEIIVGSGPGVRPEVRVFDPTTISAGSIGLIRPILNLSPFRSSDRGGVFVAVGDLHGDHTPEIIVGNGVGGNGRVELFDSTGKRFRSFRAFDNGSPVHVAAKDIDRLGFDEIITSPGTDSKHRWRVWHADANQIDEVMESDRDFANGFFVA